MSRVPRIGWGWVWVLVKSQVSAKFLWRPDRVQIQVAIFVFEIRILEVRHVRQSWGAKRLGSLLERFDGCCGDELFADFGYVVGFEADVGLVFLLELLHESCDASEGAAD